MRNSIIVIFFFFINKGVSQSDAERGVQLFKQQKYTEAVPFLEKEVTRHPENTIAKEYLGDCYGQLKNWDAAISQYKYLAQTYPKVANYHYKYGGALGMKALENKLGSLGYLDDIETEFKKAAELDPNHIDARWALVNFFTELPAVLGGKQYKALHYANELENISKVDGYLAKGFIYKEGGDFSKAEEYLKKAVKTGGSVTCYDKLIELYTAHKKFDRALLAMNEAHDKWQLNNYRYQYGKMAAEENIKVSEGISQLQKYIDNYREADSYPLEWAYLRLAQLFRRQENKQKALYWIDKSLAANPDFKIAQKEKSKILKI